MVIVALKDVGTSGAGISGDIVERILSQYLVYRTCC